MAACLGIVAVLPIRMSIHLRATMFSSVLVVGFAGAMIHGEVFEPVPVGMENIAFGIFIMALVSVMARILLIQRLSCNIQDWESSWRHVMREGLLMDLFKKYHDLD